MVLQASNLADLITMTQKELGETKFTEIATTIQRFIAMRELMKISRVQITSGTSIQRNIMVTTNGNARFTGMYATDQVNVGDVMKTIEIPWRHMVNAYAIDLREIDMNREPRRIVEILKTRKVESAIAAVQLMEQRFWRVSSTTDAYPYGVPNWIVKGSSNSTESSFTGTHPSGASSVAGLSATTYPGWANCSLDYDAITFDDIVRQLRKCMTWTDFQPPVEGIPTYATNKGYGLYTNYDVYGPMEELLRQQNDNLGNDVASKDGKVMVRGVPLTYVPELRNDTTDPIFGIDWSVFFTYVLSGWWQRVTNIEKTPGQHTVMSVFNDYTYNWMCVNRRKCFVVTNGTTELS